MLDSPTVDPASMAWLDAFQNQDGTVLISENRPFQHDEADYDNQYGNQDYDTSGRGLMNVLRKFDCDLSGPVLELGCGTGVATVGLCKARDVPWFLITDSSTAFIDITKRKLARSGVNSDRIRYAVLSDGDLDRLPDASVSAIVLRSVVHHFLDVPGWIRAAARVLRPGGVIVCEEPAAQGYLIMGIIAQTVAANETNGLTPDQRAKARLMADTMKAYNRCDMDKSAWEDKHLFRPELMNEWARAAGLESYFIPSANSESFADGLDGAVTKTDFREFFESYLQYCMNFGPGDAAQIARAGDAICSYLVEACAGTREPYLMGLFALRKGHQGDPVGVSRWGNVVVPPTPDFADTVREYWDNLDTINSSFMGLITCGNGGGVEAHYRHAEELRTFCNLVKITPETDILELGCGNGRWIVSLAPKVHRYEAVDFSEQMVAQAAALSRVQGLQNVAIERCKVEDYHPVGMYDIVYVSGVSLYISDDDLVDVLKRLRAHLKPGGVLVERSTFHRAARDTVVFRASDNYAAIYRTAQELIDIAQRAGFKLKARKPSYTYIHLPSKVVEKLNRPDIRRIVRGAAMLTYPVLRYLSAAVTARRGYPGDMALQEHEFLVFQASQCDRPPNEHLDASRSSAGAEDPETLPDAHGSES